MKRWIFAAMVLFLLAAVCLAEGKGKKEENWKEIQGVYLGNADVTNDIGAVLNTPVRILIRHGKKKHYIIEMVYFDTKVAKFTKCARLDEFKMNVFDEVEVEGRTVRISGTLSSTDGKVYSGTIYFYLMSDMGKKAIRTFEIKNLKKASAL